MWCYNVITICTHACSEMHARKSWCAKKHWEYALDVSIYSLHCNYNVISQDQYCKQESPCESKHCMSAANVQ